MSAVANKSKMSSDLKRIVKSLVRANFAGTELLSYLTERFKYNKSGEWQAIIDDSRIKVNGVVAQSDLILQKDDSLEYHHLDHPEPEVDFSYEVVHSAADFQVLNKPGNLPVHPAGKFFHNTLWAALKKEGLEPHFINRIDRETSGLILVALNKPTASNLGKQIQSKSVYKEYMTIVEGEFPQKINAQGYLEKDPNSELDKKVVYKEAVDFEKHGKNGVDTTFELIEKYSGLSLVKCVIRTGKMHQIRATLNSLGFPMVGDKIYGVDETFYLKFIHKKLSDVDLKKMRMTRQALHAHVLKFKDPQSGKALEFTCALPADMKKVLKEQ